MKILRKGLPCQCISTNLQSLSVPVTKDPLHISSWSRVASCKLTNINNSKLNKVKVVFDVLLLNFSHPTTTEVHDEVGLLGSRVRDEKPN